MQLHIGQFNRPIRIGLVPLVDSAPLVLAAECGLFKEAGLRVELMKEHGWATIRDKIAYGELDAAHALVGLCFAINWGLGVVRRDCVTGLLFNSHGDAITVSKEWCDRGVKGAGDLAAALRERKSDRPFTFGVPHLLSSHHFLLRQWFRTAGIVPDRDAEIAVIPPSQMVAMLEAGHIDGFCVGEPFNTLAVSRGSGVVLATSAEISLMHPEKALLITKEFSETRADEHLRLVSVLIKACARCDTREGREEAARILSRREYLGLDEALSRESLLQRDGDFHIFSRHEVNRPSSEKAAWVITRMREAGLLAAVDAELLRTAPRIFREDLYEAALALGQQPVSRRKPSPAKPRRKAGSGPAGDHPKTPFKETAKPTIR